MKKHVFLKIKIQTLCGLAFGLLFGIQFIFGQEQKDDIRQLIPNQIIEREMIGAEIHSYKIDLQKDEFFHVRVEQKGIDVMVKLLDASGKLLTKMDSPNGAEGFEDLYFASVEAGVYAIEVSSLEQNAPKGKYTIFRETPRTATEADRKKIEKDLKKMKAEELFDEGVILFSKKKAESYRAALATFKEAIRLYREISDQNAEGKALSAAAMILDNLGEKKDALAFFEQAFRLYVDIEDKFNEAATLGNIAKLSDDLGNKQKALNDYEKALKYFTLIDNKGVSATLLNNIGKIYSDLGNQQKAIEYYEKALPLRRAAGDKPGEAITLHNFGGAYDQWGSWQKAIKYYEEALPLHKLAGNTLGEAQTRNNLGNAYSALGDKQKALEYLNQAFKIFESLGNKSQQANTLTSIGGIYVGLGEYVKALDNYNQALPLHRNAGSKFGEAVTLQYKGSVYLYLNELNTALKYYEQALPLLREVCNKNREADTLAGIGRVYSELGNKQKALDYYTQALKLAGNTGNKSGEASFRASIGVVYFKFGEQDKAFEYLKQALPLYRTVGNKDGEALTLMGIGSAYFRSNDKAKALDNFKQALLLFRTVGDRSNELETLYNLMVVGESTNNPKLALFYGKQAINKRQELRGPIRILDNEVQKTFLRSFIFAYQSLAELLIEEGQIEQAVRVLNLYQDQQFFDFNRDTNSSVPKIALSPREQEFANRYEAAVNKAGQINLQIEELKRQIDNEQSIKQKTARLQELEAELKTANDTFLAVLKDAETDFAKADDERDKISAVPDVIEIQTALRELSASTKQNTAALYTLIGQDKFHTILITKDGIKNFEYVIKAAGLNKKIIQFYALLQSPYYDPRILGKELYEIIFKPVETELKKNKIQTLMWSLDGNLRYIPMAALSPDGKKYLVENYQNVVFTRADRERLTRPVTPIWTGYGFSTSKAHIVKRPENVEKTIEFSSLDFGKDEMQIFRTKDYSDGSMMGDVFFESQFNKKSFVETLKQKRPLVHISSHFRFYPGDSSLSFLLLGDGDIMTLSEMKEKEGLFEGVELLTLSACDTAAQFSDANGREIDGFAELAQRLGASAVIATLWQVNESSSAQLMKNFYKYRQVDRVNKAQALRKTQLDLLYGKNADRPDSTKKQNEKSGGKVFPVEDIKIEDKYRVNYKTNNKKPFSHPYYWSPFTLFGNWQ